MRPAGVLRVLFAEARRQQPLPDFTSRTDSDGNEWPTSADMSFEVGVPIYLRDPKGPLTCR